MNEESLQNLPDPTKVDPEEKSPAKEPEEPQKRNTKKGRRTKNATEETPLEPGTGQDDGTAGQDAGTAGEDSREPSPKEEPPLEVPGETALQPDGTLPHDPSVDDADPQKLERLRQELKDLREEINSARRTLVEQEIELEEFRTLFPNVSLSALPDAVLKDVRRGVPLAAAYALMERRNAHLQKIAEATNAVNSQRSSGSAGGNSVGYLSPSEVRAMTPEQVRKQYRQILLSMQKWH